MTIRRKLVDKPHVAAILALGCALPPLGAHADSPSPEDIFSAEQGVAAVALSPFDDRAFILGLYDGIPVLVVFNQSSGDSRIVANLEKASSFLPLFTSGDVLLLLRTDFRSSPSGILYSRFYSPVALDVSNADSRLLFRSGRKLEPWQGGYQPFLGQSDDRTQSYLWAYLKQPRASGQRRNPVVVAASPDTKYPRVVSTINPFANTVFIDANGFPVASLERDELEYETRIWSYGDGKETLIHDVNDNSPRIFVFGLTPNRDALIVETESVSGQWHCCNEIKLSDGSVSGPLFQREGRFVDWLLVDPNGIVVGAQFAGLYPEYEFLDDSLTRRVQKLQALYPGAAAYVADVTPDRQTIVMYVTGAHSSGEFLKFPGDTLEPTLLARNMPEIMPGYLSPTNVINFKASDGTTLQALLTIREDVQKAGPAPLIVMPDSVSERPVQVGFDPMVQYLAYSGYAVLQQRARRPKQDFVANDLEQYISSLWQDLDSGVQSLIDADIIDSERVCLIGQRYSAHTAFSAAAFSSFQYNCIVSIDGITDLSDAHRALAKRDRTASGFFSRLIDRFGKESQRLRALSPLQNVDRINSAVLLINGDTSPTDSIVQSRQMYSRLVINDKDVHWLDVADEDGTWFKFDNRRQALQTIGRFVQLHIGHTDPAQE